MDGAAPIHRLSALTVDGGDVKAYTRAVASLATPQKSAPTPGDHGSKRRRRAPDAAEQKRREEWGKTWGRLIKATAKHLRDEGN